jgi:hypothetical protein
VKKMSPQRTLSLTLQVKVIETIIGFQKRHIVHDKVIEESALQLPPTEYDTCAIVSGPTPLTCLSLSFHFSF